jgi:uncharacterized OsmC-like protein
MLAFAYPEVTMNRDAHIRAAQERVAAVFRSKPKAAFSSSRASGHLGEGLICKVRQDGHEAVMDMSKVIGGDDTAPTPGFFIRAGLIGCVAIGIKMTAAREAIALDAIDVDIEMDFDDGAMIGVGTNSAAPLETRFIITLQSSAPWDKVTAMVGRALDADPYFLALKDAQSVTSRVLCPRRQRFSQPQLSNLVNG